MLTSKQKIEAWLDDHPDDYFDRSLNEIAKEIGVPFSACNTTYP